MSRNTCWACGEESLIWDSDTDLEPEDGEDSDDAGVVSFLHCSKCEAEVEYTQKNKKDNHRQVK